MQAIILAAGMGKRLGELTRDNTKCMLKVHGKTLIERTLDILCLHQMERIILVVGYEGENVKALVGNSYKGMPVFYVENPVYFKTNNIYSLYLARKYMQEKDTLLLESDLIFEPEVITELIQNPYPNLAVVDKYQSWMDGTVVSLDKDDNILNFIPKKHFNHKDIDIYFKTVNIYKFSIEFSKNDYIPFLEAYSSALGNNEYYEQVLRVLLLLEKQNLKALRLNNQKWYEIDDVQDLSNAETIFSPESEKLKHFQHRYGGYWRFPKMKDFCYLVNPYFPPARLINEMKCYFETLLSQYPSGLNIQNLLAGKMFSCDSSQILTGNGATELINALSICLKGKIGIVFPTFNEYPEKFGYHRVEKFIPNNPDFVYTIEDLKELSKKCDHLLLINPDNPSGNYIAFEKILELAKFLNSKKKTLILDESFHDFSFDIQNNTCLRKDILSNNPNLIVVKSISKSYGVPGLRLGVLASSNLELLNEVRKNLSIWNINSFGEFFLQIIDKYEKEYSTACIKIAEERNRFFNRLKQISFLRTIPSESNFFLCEVISEYSATQLTDLLLKKHEILVKDCTAKIGFENKNYIRIAVRNYEDNEFLFEKLNSIQYH